MFSAKYTSKALPKFHRLGNFGCVQKNPFFSSCTLSSSRIIGIDLGTTNSCVSIMDGKTPKVIENEEGTRTTPSIVSFDKNGTRIVGVLAKRQMLTNAKNTFYATKRLIGRAYDDEMVNRERSLVSYEIVKHVNGDAWVHCPALRKNLSPSEIASFILKKMKDSAEKYFSQNIKEAVITVPAYFNDSQRQATKTAGQIAGLTVKRIINEPTAACLAYGLDKTKQGTIAVYDLGGGTFDISILDVKDGVFEVRATNGDTFLGGEDFDHTILQYFLDTIKMDTGHDVSKDSSVIQRLKDAAEKAKIELSSTESTDVMIPYIFLDPSTSQHHHFQMNFTRKKLEQLTLSMIEKTLDPCRKCIRDAKISKNDPITEVILVGGMTRMPKVIQTVQNFFGKIPFKGINPDECVSMGAAIQGAVLQGSINDIILVDVTPLSLGIDLIGDVYHRVIPKNSSIPSEFKTVVTTAEDNQTSMLFKIYQGERDKASANKLLGEMYLSGIPAAPRCVAQVQVTFSIDANGIVNVSAMDLASGSKCHTTVQSSSGLTSDEIERMINDAMRFEKEDKQHKEISKLKNEAETVILHAKDALLELKKETNLVAKNDEEKLNKEIEELQKELHWIDLGRIEPVKLALIKLKETQGRLSSQLYSIRQSKRNKT